MQYQLPSVDDLDKLPKWAIVAYSVRCALRVANLYHLPPGHPDNKLHRESIFRTIRIAAFDTPSKEVYEVQRAAITAAIDSADAAYEDTDVAVRIARVNAAKAAGLAIDTACTSERSSAVKSAAACSQIALEASNGQITGCIDYGGRSYGAELQAKDRGFFPEAARNDYKLLREYITPLYSNDDDPEPINGLRLLTDDSSLGPLWASDRPKWYGKASLAMILAQYHYPESVKVEQAAPLEWWASYPWSAGQAMNDASADIFISFKNLDAQGRATRDCFMAKTLAVYLRQKGFSVFLSLDSLERMGKSAYMEAIEVALQAAKVLIAVGSSVDNLNSRWVKYEWHSFHQEVIEGYKSDGEIFSLIDGITERDLPLALRLRQAFRFSEEGFGSLSRFLSRSLGRE